MIEVRKLSAAACELGEGPHYERGTDTAWWFDIVGKALVEHRFASAEAVRHPLPRMASVVARVDDARQVLAMEDGIYLRAVADGALARLAPLEADNPATRCNDGRVHPSGRLWVGTMGRKAEKGAGAIYWVGAGEVRKLFRDISIPNSICFSPDGSTGYFADTTQGRIWRVALEPATGSPKGEPEVFLTANALPHGGGFDGSVMDANGVLWNAAWGGGSISGFAPDGSCLRTIALPAKQVTCPCFTGPALDRMLVTSAWEHYDADQRAADPDAGRTFEIDGGFLGLEAPAFRLDATAPQTD